MQIVHNKLHCVDGPALTFQNGTQAWFINGKRHRIDGPAIEHASGSKQWWVDGEELTQQQFEQHPLVIFYRLSKGVV
jgi:hypothetical protein